MAFRIALLGAALVAAGIVLSTGYLAMGPVGWVVVATMLAIGFVQVHRTRRQRESGADDAPRYCPNCGTGVGSAFENVDREHPDAFSVDYCRSCGAPLRAGDGPDPAAERANCPDCGAPTDGDRTECSYCEAAL